MDYTKFLGKKEEAVLAYLGGPFAYGRDRRLRVGEPRPSLGFHRFEIEGRAARAIGPAESPDTGGLPRVRGHHVRGWITCASGASPGRAASPRHGRREGDPAARSRVEIVRLLPDEQPAPFSIVRARRWHSGDLVFESLDFDGEVEEAARLRLEKLEPLGEMKGVPASLRLAYGVALTTAIAARMGVALSVREAAAAGPRVADEGEDAARAFVGALAARRAEDAEQARSRALALDRGAREPVAARRRGAPTLDDAHLRAALALDGVDARLLSSRQLGGGNLEVAWEFMGERFISVIDALTLQVFDSGVCLAGADELVTLDSLPGVIREAIQTDALVITRR
ncbi:MAG: hypothetical protein KF782_01805 [Labilithrix sp.]|nr:hypothetical protein [Labilithrix sp.]